MRVKHAESRLLSASDFESILNLESESSAVDYLRSKGWRIDESSVEINDILKKKETDLWHFIEELVGDLTFFSSILLAKDFANLKVILRAVLSDVDVGSLLDPLALTASSVLYDSVKTQDFLNLPGFISTVAKQAFDVLLQTGDACLCDATIDNGMFKAMRQFTVKDGLAVFQQYIELLAVFSNINICVRSIKLNKNNRSFLTSALIPCKTFDLQCLMSFTISGLENLIKYLDSTNYSTFPPFVYVEGRSDLVEWFDSSVLDFIKTERQKCFTLSPIFVFILANYLEFKNLRLVFSYFRTGANKKKLLERFRHLIY